MQALKDYNVGNILVMMHYVIVMMRYVMVMIYYVVP